MTSESSLLNKNKTYATPSRSYLLAFYQGISDILSIIFLTLISSISFYFNRNNLGLLILIQGFHDIIGLTYLYLDKPNPLIAWLSQLIQ